MPLHCNVIWMDDPCRHPCRKPMQLGRRREGRRLLSGRAQSRRTRMEVHHRPTTAPAHMEYGGKRESRERRCHFISARSSSIKQKEKRNTLTSLLPGIARRRGTLGVLLDVSRICPPLSKHRCNIGISSMGYLSTYTHTHICTYMYASKPNPHTCAMPADGDSRGRLRKRRVLHHCIPTTPLLWLGGPVAF